MQIFPFNWELKILFIQLIKHSSDLLIPHKGDGFFCCIWDVCAGTWCSFRARMLSSEIHWELPAQNGILICTARCDLGNPQLCGFCKKRKKLKRAVTFCGHVLCLQSRRVIYPWKILVCIWVGLLLWETWNWALFERLEPAQVGAGGVALAGTQGGCSEEFHSPVEQFLKVCQALQPPQCLCCSETAESPISAPECQIPPIPPQTPGAWAQFALHKCQRFCLNSSHLQEGVEVVLLDQEKISSVWSLAAAISWGFCLPHVPECDKERGNSCLAACVLKQKSKLFMWFHFR